MEACGGLVNLMSDECAWPDITLLAWQTEVVLGTLRCFIKSPAVLQTAYQSILLLYKML